MATPNNRLFAIFSYIFIGLCLLSVTIFLAARLGSEQYLNPSVTSGLRPLVAPHVIEAVDQGRPAPSSISPLVQVDVAAHSLDQVNTTLLCFPEPPEGETLEQSIGDFSILWFRLAGGRREIVARHDLAPLAQTPLARRDHACVRLPPFHIASPEYGERFALILSGHATSNRRWLETSSLDTLSITAPPLSWVEKLATLLMLFAIGLRLTVWHDSTPRDDPARVRWRTFDMVVGYVFVILAVALSIGIIGKEPDTGLRMLLSMLPPTIAFTLIPRSIAGRRTKTPRSALALVTPTGPLQTWPMLAAGIALGALVVLALAAMPEPSSNSLMQDMTRMPGGVLVIATMAAISPWYEEYFFRGFIFGGVESKTSGPIAIAVSAALHMIIMLPQHIGFLWPVAGALLMSIAAGYVRWK